MDNKISPTEQVKMLFIGGLSLLLLIPEILFAGFIIWIIWAIVAAVVTA